jgi:hypothetical protein
VDLLLAELQARLADRDLTLELTPAARGVIARDGHDPQFGARPLKRSLQRLVENSLARALLQGRFGPGSHIALDADPVSGTLVFSGDDGAAVVAESAERRDARAADAQPVTVGGRSIFDLPTGSDGPEGPDRLN